MRILMVAIYDVARTGGLSSHVAELSEALARDGHAVRIATPSTETPRWKLRFVLDAPRLPMRAIDRDQAYLHFLAWGRRYLARGIARRLSAEPADVVHAHDPLAALAAADTLAAHTPGADAPCLVLTVHGDVANMAASDRVIRPAGRARRRVEEFEAEAYRRADLLIAVDGRLRDHCERIGGPRTIEVVRNFVDATRFRPPEPGDREALEDSRASLGLDRGAKVLLVPRRLVKKNGVVHAVRAMSQLTWGSAESQAVLVVAGRGPERPALEQESRRLGLAGSPAVVRFIGDVPRDRLATLYRLADAVLVPSVPHEGVIEATSIAALEAMASARPVIASAIGGLAEIIEDGRTGLLVPAGNDRAIAEAVARVLEDAALARGIGDAARRAVEERYSTRAGARRIVALYAAAAAAPRRPAGPERERG